MKLNKYLVWLYILFLVLSSSSFAQLVFKENSSYKDADALRDILKSKGLTDAEADGALLKYVNAGYNLKDVKIAVDAKYAIETMSDAEKIVYLQEHFSSSVSHLKNDYGLADADILKLSDQGVPLSSLYGKLTRIAEDEGFGKRFALMTADGIKKGVIKADTVSPITLAEYIKNVKSIKIFPKELAPWDAREGIQAKQQTLILMKAGDPRIRTIIEDGGTMVGEPLQGTSVLKLGNANENWGWLHVIERNHNNEIQEALGLPDNLESVKDVIMEVVEKPDSVVYTEGDAFELTKSVTRSKTHNIKVIISDEPGNIGSFQTANPD